MAFDLEKAILAWRRPYEMNTTLSDEDVEELEGSLRDRIDAEVERGCSEEEAFKWAVKRAGTYATIDTEYRKVYWEKRRRYHELGDEFKWRSVMLKRFFKMAIRNAFQHKAYTFINVTGLSVGLACSFFILLWVMHETSFDQFHENGDRIYRVLRNETNNEEVITRFSTAGPMRDILIRDYPEVEDAVRGGWGGSFLVNYGDVAFREEGNHVDPGFFEMFSFPLLQGDPASVLEVENSVAISKTVADKLFGADWQDQNAAMGSLIKINQQKDFTVTGVFEDFPHNSSFRFDILLPIEDLIAQNPWAQRWGGNAFPLFVTLNDNANVADVNLKVTGIMDQYSPEEAGEVVFLEKFSEMHLYDRYENGVAVGGRIELIRLFVIIVIFLLIIASINFMNLATARSSQRSREIGVRKAIGASQPALAGQFLAETMLLATVAFSIAMLLVIVLLPAFNLLTGKHISFLELSPTYFIGALAIALLTGLLAGSYPAIYLSSFNPVAILRGRFKQKPGSARLRKGLAIFQFSLSTLIIVCTVVVYFQIQYIMEKDLGLDRSQVISMRMEGEVRNQFETFRQELIRHPSIVNVAASSQNPLSIGRSTSGVSWEGRDPDDETEFSVINVDFDFAETMKMSMAAGRFYDKQFSADSASYVLNEAAANLMQKENPVGERLTLWRQPGTVIGVVKDFHMTSFESPIRPTILRLDPENTFVIWVRTEPGRTEEAIAALSSVATSINRDYPFEYSFLDQDYESLYQSTLVMGKLANIFALVAILISCLGLFGLASFTAERRTKEIGIRKVLGASSSNLVMLLSTDFTKLVLIGFLLGAPIAWVIANRWLASFAYRIEVSPLTFFLTGIVVFLTAQLTVSYQSIKAALSDPVESLRSE